MDTNNNNTMDPKRYDDFQTVWKRRKQDWQKQAEKTLPDDVTLLHLAELAQQHAQQHEVVGISINQRRKRWIPYAAAACIAVGVAAIGLNLHDDTVDPLPETEEVTVGDQTIHFLCNKGCSAQEVMLSAIEVIK